MHDIKITLAASLLACFAATPAWAKTAQPPAVPPAGVTAGPASLTFDDEFDHFVGSPDGGVGWMTCYPYGGQSARSLPANGEAQFYSDSSVGISPFSVKDGVLSITAARAEPGSNPYNLPYTSGIITTFKSFSQTYGYFEIRAKLPAGRGLWPAFWLLPASVHYSSELDIFEVLGHDLTTLHATTHSHPDKTWIGYGQKLKVPDMSTGFHIYGADWGPHTITLYMDGNVIGTAPTPPTMNKPMYILVNLAVGTTKSWPGAPDPNTKFPASLQVDYVRAFATADTIQVAGPAALKATPSAAK